MKTLADIQYLKGVNVLTRVDFNVPIKNGVVVDDFRIRMSLPTVQYLMSRGAKVILIAHLESSDGSNNSLAPVAQSLNTLGIKTTFVENMRNAKKEIDMMNDGEVILLNNLRLNEGEKDNDPEFAKELASLADIYVNDAFSVSHREHASVVGVPQYIQGYVGLQMEQEITHLSRAFTPTHPFIFILGGAKFETKVPLIDKFLQTADTVYVAGALANDFFKAQGYEVGVSLLSKGSFDFDSFLHNTKLKIPVDVVNQDHQMMDANHVSKTDKIMDAGMKSVQELGSIISQAQFILWNGPFGLYEDGYQGATLEVARMIAEATQKGATSIIGGGDTLAAVASLGLSDKLTFVSTGGGAMLDFLATGTLPGIQALEHFGKAE
ncbi:MAG: phosphoglycerate kinase [Candidatus Taylorbacteria bacterium]